MKISTSMAWNKQERQNKPKMYSTAIRGNVAAGRSLAGIFCMIPGQLDRWTEKIVA